MMRLDFAWIRHRRRAFIAKTTMIVMAVCTCATVSAQPSSDNPPQDKPLPGIALTAKAFRLAAQRIEPSLVTIESFGGVSTAAGRIGGIRQRGEGNTTGVMISPDGFVVTSSFNFIEQPPVITVITSDGQRRVAKLMGRDDSRRICLLRVEGVSDMPVPEMAPLNEVQVGQWAVSVGVGYGDKNPAISIGIISAKNRIGGRAVQTDANISPANYGGPLVDIAGRMIGVCVPIAPNSGSLGSGVEWYDSGIGFAIPLHGADELIERLKQGVHIQRAFLGIRSEDDEDQPGIKVVQVVPGTAAANAELKTNDRITRIDDQEINNVMDLRKVLAQYMAGDEITLTYQRDDEEFHKQVKLGAPPKPEDEDTPSLFPGRRRTPGRR